MQEGVWIALLNYGVGKYIHLFTFEFFFLYGLGSKQTGFLVVNFSATIWGMLITISVFNVIITLFLLFDTLSAFLTYCVVKMSSMMNDLKSLGKHEQQLFVTHHLFFCICCF